MLLSIPWSQDPDEELPPAPEARPRLETFKDQILAKLKNLQEKTKVLDIVLQVLEDPVMKHYALQFLVDPRCVFVSRCLLATAGDSVVRCLPWRFDFYFSHMLRIAYAARGLRREHLEILEMSSNRGQNLQMQANWAARGWASAIQATLAVLSDEQAMQRLELRPFPGLLLRDNRPQDPASFLRLSVLTAAQRAWSMSIWSETAPYQWASLLHNDPDIASAGLKKLEEDWSSVDKAFKMQGQADAPDPEDSVLRQLS